MWLLGCLVLAIASRIDAQSEVGVYLEFEQSPSPATVDAMRDTAVRDLKPLGFHVIWRMLSENQGDESFQNLAMVKLSGACACKSLMPASREILVLGSTAVQDGQVLPYGQVYCDALRRVLPVAEFDVDRTRGDAILGRAVGRVLAHELYHILKQTTHHPATGIAKAIQTSNELTSADFSFDITPLTAK